MTLLHIANLNPAGSRPVAGEMLALTVSLVETGHVESESLPIAVDWFSSGSDGSHASDAQLLQAGIQFSDSEFEATPVLAVRTGGGLTRRDVRAPVKEFIKRVVVPILVEGYISRMNRDTLLARTGGAS